jgi:hypothetical protein
VTPTARAITLETSHGFRALRDLAATGGVAVEHEYRLSQQPYSSYEVVVDSTSGDIGPGLVLRRVAADGVTVVQESQGVSALDFSRSLRWANDGPAAVSDQVVRVHSGSCWTDCGLDDVYRLRTYDTTYSLARFNNSATQVTVLLIENTTSGPVAGRAYFWSAAGTLLATSVLSLPPMGSVSLNTSSVPGLAGQGGSITITHDAGYGQLTGKAVSLEPASGMSFDTPLLPRAR